MDNGVLLREIQLMPTLPRTNGAIFDSGHLFTPDQFPRAWNMTMAALEAGVSSGEAGGYSLAILGAGRLVTMSYFSGDIGAPSPVGGALAVRLPVATYYLANESGAIHIVTLDAPLDLPVDAGLDHRFGYLQAALVPDNGDEYTVEIKQWSGTARPDLVALGYPSLGWVTSDSQGVTAIDGSVADVIWPLPLIQKRLKDLSGDAGGDGSGSGTGDVSALQFNALIARVIQNENDIAGLAAQIALLQQGADVFPAPFDQLAEHIGALAGGLGEVNPPAIERLQISVIGANFGHGQNDTPDFTPDTGDPLELPFNPETGSFGF